MNRRNFLRSLFASTAAIVVAPADILPTRSYFDMGASEAKRLENLAAQCRAHMLGGEWSYVRPDGTVSRVEVRWALVGT